MNSGTFTSTEKEVKISKVKSFNVKFEQVSKYSTSKREVKVDCGTKELAEILVLQRFKGIKNFNQVNKTYQFNGKVKILSVKEVK